MKTYKMLVSGFAVASMLAASVASAQVATTTSATGTVNSDVAVSIGNGGIIINNMSGSAVQIWGLPFSISGGVGGSCQLTNAGAALGTVGAANTVNFNNAVTVGANSSVTLPITCTGSTAGTYTVSLVTSGIPATIAGTNISITPRGIGGSADNDTTAVGTLTINSSGNVGGVTGNTGSTGGSVLGDSTSVPNVPNTGAGGAAAFNLALLALAALAAVGGVVALRKLEA